MNFETDLDETIRQLIPPTNISSTNSKVKRPPNAYNLYYLERQPKMKIESPLMSGNEISKLIGAEWKEMSEESKKPYYEEAKKIHEAFKREHPNWHYEKSSEKQSRKRQKNAVPGFFDNNPQGMPDYSDPNNGTIMLLGANLLAQFIMSRKDVLDEFQQYVKNFTTYKAGFVDDSHYSIPQ